MAERDPFGRLPDENPLAFLGGRPGNGTEAAAAEAVAAEQATAAERAAFPEPAAPAERATPADPQQLSMADLVRPRTRATTTTVVDPALVRRIARGVIGSAVLFAVLVVVLAVVGLFAAGSDSDESPAVQVEQSEQAAPESPSSNTPPPPPASRPAATPRGLNASSLLTRRKLAPALRRLGTSGLGRLYSLSIRPARIDVQLLTRDGRLRSVQVRSDGRLDASGASGPGFGHLETTAFARVQAGAPERLARGAAERLHRPASQVDYVVLTRFGAELSWSVFMRDGKHFLADARGRITRRIS
jgi:hypothetical protein